MENLPKEVFYYSTLVLLGLLPWLYISIKRRKRGWVPFLAIAIAAFLSTEWPGLYFVVLVSGGIAAIFIESIDDTGGFLLENNYCYECGASMVNQAGYCTECGEEAIE